MGRKRASEEDNAAKAKAKAKTKAKASPKPKVSAKAEPKRKKNDPDELRLPDGFKCDMNQYLVAKKHDCSPGSPIPQTAVLPYFLEKVQSMQGDWKTNLHSKVADVSMQRDRMNVLMEEVVSHADMEKYTRQLPASSEAVFGRHEVDDITGFIVWLVEQGSDGNATATSAADDVGGDRDRAKQEEMVSEERAPEKVAAPDNLKGQENDVDLDMDGVDQPAGAIMDIDIDIPDPPSLLTFPESGLLRPPQQLDYFMDGFDYDTMVKILDEDDYDYMFELQRATLHPQFRSYYKEAYRMLFLEDEDSALTWVWGDDSTGDGLADLWEFISWLRTNHLGEPYPEPTEPDPPGKELSETSGEVFTLEQLINKARESVEHKKTAQGGKTCDVFGMEEAVTGVFNHMSLSTKALEQLLSAAQSHPLMFEHELDMTSSAGSDHSGEVWKFGQAPDLKTNVNDLIQFIVWLLAADHEGSSTDVKQMQTSVAEKNEKEKNITTKAEVDQESDKEGKKEETNHRKKKRGPVNVDESILSRQKDASWDGRVSLEDADIYVKGRLAEYPNPEDVLGSASEASYVFAAG
eukprot:symbB.v1.2.029104.t1/scaffold3083.1/size103308/4